MFRLILSIAIGWILGRERKKHDKNAGSRTLSLICCSACLLAVLSLELSKVQTFDFVRLMSYFLPAIGFIGMGIVHRSGGNVDGLTTSATLLAVLPIGFCLGLGYFFYGIISAIFVYILLESKYWKGIKND